MLLGGQLGCISNRELKQEDLGTWSSTTASIYNRELKLNSIARMWWAFLCVFVDCGGLFCGVFDVLRLLALEF